MFGKFATDIKDSLLWNFALQVYREFHMYSYVELCKKIMKEKKIKEV